MDQAPLRAGDIVEVLPATAPPGQPPAPRPHGVVLAVDQGTRRATVRLYGRRFATELPLAQLRRVGR